MENTWYNPMTGKIEDNSTMPQAFSTNERGQVWDPRMRTWSNETVDFLKQREAQFAANPDQPAAWTAKSGWQGGAAPIPDFSQMSFNPQTGVWQGQPSPAAPQQTSAPAVAQFPFRPVQYGGGFSSPRLGGLLGGSNAGMVGGSNSFGGSQPSMGQPLGQYTGGFSGGRNTFGFSPFGMNSFFSNFWGRK